MMVGGGEGVVYGGILSYPMGGRNPGYPWVLIVDS